MQQIINTFIPSLSYFNGYVMAPFFFALFFGFSIFIYFFFGYCMARMGKKVGVQNTWRAYVPIFSQFFMYDLAAVSYTWFLMWLIPFLITGATFFTGTEGRRFIISISPFLRVLSLVNLIVVIYIWMRISMRLGKSMWLGILTIIPIANIILTIYLAFSDSSNGVDTLTTPSKDSTQSWKHPELKEGESVIGNFTQEDFDTKVRWQTKRIGVVAYDHNESVLVDKQLHPVFVTKAELETAGLKTA